MLRELFIRALPQFKSSPHVADLEAFAESLHEAGYRLHSKQRHVRRLHRVLTAASNTHRAQLVSQFPQHKRSSNT